MCQNHNDIENLPPELEGAEFAEGVKPGDLKPQRDSEFADLEDEFFHTDLRPGETAGPQVKRDITEDDLGPFKQVPCPKCHGSGQWVGGYTNHVVRTCFKCGGTGRCAPSKKKPLDMSPEAQERRRKARIQRRDKKIRDANEHNAAEAEWKQTDELGKFLVSVASWNEFAVEMLNKHHKFGEFTPNQEAAIRRMMEKQKARQDRPADAELGGAGLDAIMKIFSNALDSGLKRPVLRIGEIKVSLAPAGGRNAGHLYVKLNDDYQGKIDPEGKWFAIRDADESVTGRLEEIAKDPLAAAVLHGRQTGNCACCGRELTAKESVERGIGPICAEKWGL